MGALTFYFDRCFGTRFPEALWKARPPFTVEHHHNKNNRFPQNMTDDDWLKIIGAKGWIAFSHDRRFHDNSPAVAAIKQYGIGCFYLWGGQAETWEKLRCFIRGYDKIEATIAAERKPFIFQVGHNCRITRVPIP